MQVCAQKYCTSILIRNGVEDVKSHKTKGELYNIYPTVEMIVSPAKMMMERVRKTNHRMTGPSSSYKVRGEAGLLQKR